MPAPERHLEEHFETLEKQTHASELGMWVFLGSELLLFAALFALYGGYRAAYPEAFRSAAGHTDLVLGTVNTFILIGSSFVVALAVFAMRQNTPRPAIGLLAGAALLGLVFLGLKALEYSHHFQEGIFPGRYYEFERLPGEGPAVFFGLYYLMTGLHALHVAGGIVLLGALAWFAHRGRFDAVYHTPIELGGMYWHFVDIVWIFLWPLFYLLR